MGGTGAVALAAFGLSACNGAGGEATNGAGTNSARFAWYGGAERQQAYMELIELFESQNEGSTIVPEYADYTPYQDRLATQFAAGDGPDLFFLAGFNILEFAQAGMYQDVEEFTPDLLDLSALDQDLLEDSRIDGELTAIPYAYFSPIIRSNRDFLEEVGMELPDDESWTWDDFEELSQEFSDATEEGRWGTSYYPHLDLPFRSWLRQHGQDLWTEDGRVGFDADGMAGWMELWERMRASGAAVPFGVQGGVQPESDTSVRVLFNLANANHLANEQPSVDWELDPHLVPVVANASAGHRYLHRVRFAMYRDAADPELTARFMSFLLNSEKVPELVGLNSGVPTAQHLQEVARETADATGIKILDIVQREAAMESKPVYEAPPGSGSWRDMMARAIEAIAAGGESIDTEAKRFVNDLSEAVERGND